MGDIVPQTADDDATPVGQLSSFDFHGREAAVYEDNRGHWVFMNQLCGFMGIDTRSQRKRVERNSWSETWKVIMTLQVPGDTQAREHFLLHQRRLPMWLGSIETTRIKNPEVRARVVDYQTEFADVLADYVFEGGAINPRATPQQLAELTDKAHAWEMLASEGYDFSAREVGFILDRDPGISIGQNNIFKVLRLLGLIDAKNVPYKKHKKLLTMKPGKTYVNRTTGHEHAGRLQVRFTMEGVRHIHGVLGGTIPLKDHVTAARRTREL